MDKRILIVDDQENMRLMLKLTFEDDFIVEEAASGLEAIEKAGKNIYHLIIMDIMMPGIDGYTTITRIRNLNGYEATPFFIMTAKDESNFKKLSKVFGAVYHFTKPFDPEMILEKAREILI